MVLGQAVLWESEYIPFGHWGVSHLYDKLDICNIGGPNGRCNDYILIKNWGHLGMISHRWRHCQWETFLGILQCRGGWIHPTNNEQPEDLCCVDWIFW